jgi:hypothetical protein
VALTIQPISLLPRSWGNEVRGDLVRGERLLYSFDGKTGQLLTLDISSPERNAVFQLYYPGATAYTDAVGIEIAGTPLTGAAEGNDAKMWSGKLNDTGAYLLVVGSTRGNTDFTLNIMVRW